MTPAVEFSHKVTVEPWPEDGILVDLTATPAELEALKTRFDLIDLPSLSASLRIEKKVKELVLTGTIEATVTQSCVATLKPVTSALQAPMQRHYRRQEVHEKMTAAGTAVSVDEDEVDVDILDDDEIDIGEVVAEEFYLALDPYPRTADADVVLDAFKEQTGKASDQGSENPFEKLRRH
ncbi:MAG: YceD family protein [Geminicoccaceae bacterium]